MNKRKALLKRLDDIGYSIADSGNGLALLALGSVGKELARIDQYSDLDFFVIVKPGCKKLFMDNLTWLSSIAEIAFYFQNTVDGFKLLFADGIFCEFAIFEVAELSNIPFAEGRIIWKDNNFDEAICQPSIKISPHKQPKEWIIGEILTNLYIGLGRYHRGEKISAFRLIQVYAIDRILELAEYIESEESIAVDIFARERRFEQRYPNIAKKLNSFMPGYQSAFQATHEIINFLEDYFVIDQKMKQAILDLCNEQY